MKPTPKVAQTEPAIVEPAIVEPEIVVEPAIVEQPTESLEAPTIYTVMYDRDLSYCDAPTLNINGVLLKHGKNVITPEELALLQDPLFTDVSSTWEMV